jgi:hypothetical protein
MDDGKVFTEPVYRPGSTSTHPKSGSFGKNIGSSAVSPNFRRKCESSMPKGKDEKLNSPIKKKPRIESDDEKNHGEGNGESEKVLQGPSQDGFSVNHTDNQGNIYSNEDSNKTEVGGLTTGKLKVTSQGRTPRTKIAPGSLARRGWTPNPQYTKSEQ